MLLNVTKLYLYSCNWSGILVTVCYCRILHHSFLLLQVHALCQQYLHGVDRNVLSAVLNICDVEQSGLVKYDMSDLLLLLLFILIVLFLF